MILKKLLNTHLRLFWVDFNLNLTLDINPPLLKILFSLGCSYSFVVKNSACLKLSIKFVSFQNLTFFNLLFPGFKGAGTIYLMVKDFDRFSVLENLNFGILMFCPQIIKLNGSVYKASSIYQFFCWCEKCCYERHNKAHHIN